jgi:hypothetical protein
MRLSAPWILLLAIAVTVPDLLIGRTISAQTFVTPKGEAQNVRFELRDEGIVHIYYDLVSSEPRAVYSVMLEASQDAGTTFGMRPQSVTGDVGDKVAPGPGKRIVWDSGKDVERVQIDRFRFRIVATGGPLQSPPVQTAATPAPPAPAKPTPPPAAAGAKKGRNPLVWVGIGAGALAAGGVAIAASGTGGPGPDPPPNPQPVNRQPTVTQTSLSDSGTLLATATNVRFSVTATDPDNDNLTGTVDFGDGTTSTGSMPGGSQSYDKVYNNAGTYSPRVTVSDGRGGTATASTAQVTVGTMTGGWRAEFQGYPQFPFAPMNVNQSGRNLNGTAIYDGRAWNITGSVSSDRRATLVMSDSAGRAGDFRWELTGSADLRVFTGTEATLGLLWTMTKQ